MHKEAELMGQTVVVIRGGAVQAVTAAHENALPTAAEGDILSLTRPDR